MDSSVLEEGHYSLISLSVTHQLQTARKGAKGSVFHIRNYKRDVKEILGWNSISKTLR